jgi:hypothetical protein
MDSSDFRTPADETILTFNTQGRLTSACAFSFLKAERM